MRAVRRGAPDVDATGPSASGATTGCRAAEPDEGLSVESLARAKNDGSVADELLSRLNPYRATETGR